MSHSALVDGRNGRAHSSASEAISSVQAISDALDSHRVMSQKHVGIRIHHRPRGAREAPECPFADALCVVVRGQSQKEESVGDEGFDLFNSHVLTFLLTIKKLGGVYAGI